MVSDGDFDITTSEWNEIPKSANTQIVPEDVGHFSFSQSRQFSFLHKRTTMLFIGPKNAPTAQMHYTKTDTSRAGFGVGSMSSAVFLIVSKFDGVPFSDCFKVLQYWVLERGKKQDTTKVTCGINVHFHKPTMMRSKIESGVKDEMASQVRRLLTSIIKSVKRGGTPHINKINSNPSFQPFSILGGSDTTKLVDVGKSTMYTNMLNLSSNKWIHILFSVIVICSVVTLLTR